MSAMSASPPVKPVGAPLMPMSLIAEHKVPSPVAGAMPREKLTPTKQPAPAPAQPPTANGMEALSPPNQPPVPDLPPPLLHNSTPPVQQLPEQPLPPPAQDAKADAVVLGGGPGGAPPTGGETGQPCEENNIVKEAVVAPPGAAPPLEEERAVVAEPEKVERKEEKEKKVEKEETDEKKGGEESVGGVAGVGGEGEPTGAQTTPPPQQPPPNPPPPKPSDIKVATIPQPRAPKRKPIKVVSESKKEKEVENDASKGDGRKSKRMRLPTQPYQSPIPELNLIAKISKIDKTPNKIIDEKLIVFYRNEFLAVRNAEGGFYICQALQNIYKSSAKIRIRWLSQQEDDVYQPDFYDTTDFDCILTNLELEKVEKHKFRLPAKESQRTESILKRAIDFEKGVTDDTQPTEEHPDGLDLSLFRNEDQLKKRKSKSRAKSPKKKSVSTPKKSSTRRSAGKKLSDSSGSENFLEASSTSVVSKKRGSTTGSTTRRGAKKKKLVAVKKIIGKKGVVGVAKRGEPVAGSAKRGEGLKAGAKRKAPPVTQPAPTNNSTEKRPRRAQPPDTNTKTKSVGGAAKGKQLRERRAARK